MKVWRVLVIAVGVLGLIWFVLPLALSVSLNIGNMTGIAVAVLLLFYGLLMPKVHGLAVMWRKHKVKKWIFRGFLGLISVVAALVVVESACMIHAAGKEPEPGATVVVLGCRVYGERASLSMIERLKAAYEYLVENETSVCVVSGGQGDGENITEAECMYRYLVERGIAPERIYKEEQSTDTQENLWYSKKLIEKEGLYPVIAIATSEYHEYRAGRIAKSLSIQYGAVPGHTAIWLFPTYYVRELYAILAEWLF